MMLIGVIADLKAEGKEMIVMIGLKSFSSECCD